MRILPQAPLYEGYIPSSIELNHEEAHLDITAPSLCKIEEESKMAPESLSLRCTLRPIPLRDRTAKVCLISESSPLETATLYNPETVSAGYDKSLSFSQWQGVAIEYEGTGRGKIEGTEFAFSGSELPQGHLEIPHPLYIKPFQTEKTSYQLCKTTVGPHQVLTSPPGKLNSVILGGYGGYYQPGSSLKECQQIYYALSSEYDQTRIYLYSSDLLYSQYTPPPCGGHKGEEEFIFYPQPSEEEAISLVGALAAGCARLTVRTSFGGVAYRSWLGEDLPGHPHFVTVHFTPD